MIDSLIGILNDYKLCYSTDKHIIVPDILSLYVNEKNNHFSDYQKYIIKYDISSKVIFQFLLIHLIEYRLDDLHMWRNAVEIVYNDSKIFIEQSGKELIIYLNQRIVDTFHFVLTNLVQVHKDGIPYEVLIPYNKPEKEVIIIMEQIINNGGQVIFAKDNANVTATNIYNGANVDELQKLLEQLKNASKALSEEDKENADNSIEIIEDEIKSKEPRKKYLRTAITVLKGIKGTAEFAAAVAAIAEFIKTVI